MAKSNRKVATVVVLGDIGKQSIKNYLQNPY